MAYDISSDEAKELRVRFEAACNEEYNFSKGILEAIDNNINPNIILQLINDYGALNEKKMLLFKKLQKFRI